nr:hypothetical protein [Tanacetum cinerariifolium]
MADHAFAPQHNMIAYLKKTISNAKFHQIVDFLTSSSIHHSLTIHAIVDGKTVVITESSVRRDLLFTDANGITCLTNEQIFKNLLLIRYEEEGSGSGPGHQETMGGAMAQVRPEGASIQSLDPPVSTGYTVGKNVKTAKEKEIASLQKRVTNLEQRQSLRISGFHPFRTGTSKRHGLGIKFNLDNNADTEMIVKDKGNGEKGGSTAETVSTTRPDISAARPKVSTAEPKTPPTIETLFDDEDVTIADTLIDADHELAVRLTHEEQEKYIVEERSKLLAEFFERKKKQLVKERVEVGSEEDEKRIGSRKKRVAGSSSKHKSPKKQKVNDQEYEDSDKEHRKCLKVVPDEEKAIDYETLDVKSLIVDYESQVLGTNEAGNVHLYKLTRLDGSYRHFSTFSRILEVLDRQDVLDLHKIFIERFPDSDPEGYDLILWGDLKTLVESSEDDEICRNQQDWKFLSWKLYETCGVHTLMLDDSLVSINVFVEKRYPLTKEILKKMLSLRLEAKTKSTLALDLIKFIKLQIEEK